MHIKIEELPTLVGREVGVSDWLLVDQDRVNRFADATGDHQWIHVDVERATRELGGTIAHGYLTLSLVPALVDDMLTFEQSSHNLNYGADRLRFTAPVKVGKRVRARKTIKTVEPRGGGWQITAEIKIEIEGEEKPALIMDMRTLAFP
ncbi:MaoC family dehydratase [Tianweitania sediminis]|jgi:acyl dehydratase|uniref:MaoC family dehydratase n=1 Tax=Tianweitania sediminis TaxID=1502156 RepID=A0A8J7RMQ6_9HYPH|nr:MaoC family dehydratase [Tianweitania sediminis]MBP0441206.1 MaoC family dehydratase [Tianweitania sediminis]HEV7416623.1 MaoC family dehydratase [Tianweitania sediminis]